MKTDFFLEAINDIDDKYINEAREKTMKKKFNFKPIIAIAACAALALAAVPVVNHFVNTPGIENPDNGNDTMFTVYESGAHDSTTIGTHKIEIMLDSERALFKDGSKRGSEATVTLNGLEWSGIYKRSATGTNYGAPYDEYTGLSNGENVTFSINSVTGKCESFFVDHRDKTEGEDLTRDELYAIAYENFMNGGYTDDPENYTLSAEHDQRAGGYWFQFSRYIDGIQTCDYVVICIRKSGNFYWFIGNHVGEMKDVDVSEIDMDKFYAAVEAKLKAIYADAYISFDKKGAVYTKLTDGSYVFDYHVEVTVHGPAGIMHDGCCLTILMDK